MARSLRLLIPLFAVACAVPAYSQTATPAPGGAPPAGTPPKQQQRQPGAWLGGGRKSPFDGTPSPAPEFENVRRALDALTPEQRQRFQENFRRWANLSPEEKKALADREDVRKRVMTLEVELAMKESGLTLEGDQREQFIKRYGDERRKIEEQLRKEINEKRKPLVRDLIGRLKTEFSTPTVSASTPPVPAAATPAAPSAVH